MALYLGRQKIAPVVNTIDVTLADATESDVLAGKTFFSGDNVIKTGTLVPQDRLALFLADSIGEVKEEDLNGLTKIRKYQFAYYPNALTVNIPQSVTKIEEYAFYYSGADVVKLNENSQLTSIGSYSFYSSSLKSIVIPKNVSYIGSNAFGYCSYLGNIEFEQGCPITSIGSSVFTNSGGRAPAAFNIDLTPCVNLKYLESNAFYGVPIKNLKLPETILTINSNVVSSSSLNELTILATTPPTLNANSNFSAFKKIYIPAGTLSAYESATNWSAFAGKFVELEA